MALTFASLRRTNGYNNFPETTSINLLRLLIQNRYFRQEKAGSECNFQKSHFATLLAKISPTKCRRNGGSFRSSGSRDIRSGADSVWKNGDFRRAMVRAGETGNLFITMPRLVRLPERAWFVQFCGADKRSVNSSGNWHDLSLFFSSFPSPSSTHHLLVFRFDEQMALPDLKVFSSHHEDISLHLTRWIFKNPLRWILKAGFQRSTGFENPDLETSLRLIHAPFDHSLGSSVSLRISPFPGLVSIYFLEYRVGISGTFSNGAVSRFCFATEELFPLQSIGVV